MNKRLHLLISGRVQGVCFRAYTVGEAQQLGVRGWVRNLPDGRVEAMAEGSKDKLLLFEQWCSHGPPAARVTHVESHWLQATGEFKSFGISF